MAHILIATEDSLLHRILAAECEGDGHTTAWAVHGEDARQMTLDEGPDLVFSELNLSIFNGFELCELIRSDPQVPPGLPFVLLTDDEVNPRQVQRSGVTEVFPVTHALHEIRELLAEVLLHSDRVAADREARRLKP